MSGSDVECIKLNERNDLIYVDLNLFSDVSRQVGQFLTVSIIVLVQ